MCWITNKEPQCKVAKEDISTLKLVEKPRRYNFFYPYYRYEPGFTYLLNVITPKIQIKIEFSKLELYEEGVGLKYEIYQGYHSYEQGSIWEKPIFIASRNLVLINNDAYFIPYWSSLCIVECTIPKGVKYYVNECGEYVSEQIVINKILKEFNHVF